MRASACNEAVHGARLTFEHGVGITTSRTYEIMRVDSDYFEA